MMNSNAMYEIDKSVTLMVNGWSGHFSLVDILGVWCANNLLFVMIALVALRWWTIGNYPSIRHAALVACLSFFGALAINMLIGWFFHRIRPNEAGLTHALTTISPDWSFPSDHSATSMSIAAALWFQDHKKLAAGLLVAALTLCVSRVFVGAHYVSDVIGGAVIGIFAAYIVSNSFGENNKLSRLLIRLF